MNPDQIVGKLEYRECQTGAIIFVETATEKRPNQKLDANCYPYHKSNSKLCNVSFRSNSLELQMVRDDGTNAAGDMFDLSIRHAREQR